MYALFFSLLLFFMLLFLNNMKSAHENMTNNAPSNSEVNNVSKYQPYSGSDPMILAQKNAANIQYLKERLNALQKVEKDFNALNVTVDQNTNNIKKMAQYTANHITQTTGIMPTSATPQSISKLSTIS